VRAARAAARAYREQMAEYAQMRVLDVWYDKIDLAKVIAVVIQTCSSGRCENSASSG
jgi:hypothetical protein